LEERVRPFGRETIDRNIPPPHAAGSLEHRGHPRLHLQRYTHALEPSAAGQLLDGRRLRGSNDLLKEDIHVKTKEVAAADAANQILIHACRVEYVVRSPARAATARSGFGKFAWGF
jgi:hypothetical protein